MSSSDKIIDKLAMPKSAVADMARAVPTDVLLPVPQIVRFSSCAYPTTARRAVKWLGKLNHWPAKATNE